MAFLNVDIGNPNMHIPWTCRFGAHSRQIDMRYNNTAQVAFLKVDIDNPNVLDTVTDHNVTGVPTVSSPLLGAAKSPVCGEAGGEGGCMW